MDNILVSEHTSHDNYRTSFVYTRGNSYRVFCYDCYFEKEEEHYTNTLDQAEDIAENWVLYA